MTSDPWKELGFAIRQARLGRGWSMGDLAGHALENEARKGYVGQVEKGARNLSPETIDKFDQALDLPADIVKAAQLAPPPARDNQAETATSEQIDQDAEKLIAKAQAGDTGVVTGERLLIDLAYDFAEGQHNDFFTAYKGLRAALEAAQELKAQGNLPQNTSSQLDAVLRRVSEMNEEGDRDGAAEFLAAEEKRLDAESEALFNALLKQDRVRNRPDLAAKRLYKDTTRKAHEVGRKRFVAIDDLITEWRDDGDKSGDMFSLQVALELAKTNNDRASGKHAAFTLLSLGWCYYRLAERSPKEGLLKAAQNAYQEALRKTNRAIEPLNWSAYQNGLATTLSEIGKRNSDDAILRKSVSAFRAALEVGKKHKSPTISLTWNNLGNALQNLGELTADPVPLEEAITYLTKSLSLEDKNTDPVSWEETQNNRGLALRWLGVVTEDLERLDQAREAYGECEMLDLSEEAPMQWAMNQWNIADLALARFALDPDPALLVEAREYVTRARDFFVEGSEYQTQRCDELIARIDAMEVVA